MALAIVVAIGFAGSQTASAGEYSRGNDGTAAKGKVYDGTASVCAFNGADEPDESNGGGEPDFDDPLWALTPSGGHAQTGGQLVAAGFEDVTGTGFSWACNPNSGFEE